MSDKERAGQQEPPVILSDDDLARLDDAREKDFPHIRLTKHDLQQLFPDGLPDWLTNY